MRECRHRWETQGPADDRRVICVKCGADRKPRPTLKDTLAKRLECHLDPCLHHKVAS